MSNEEQSISIIEANGLMAAETFDPAVLSGKRVLITGASGLIGTGLTAALCSGHDRTRNSVIYAQTLSQPPPHLQRWADQGAIRLLQANLSEPSDWSSVPEADFILHAAGYGQPGKFLTDPFSTLMLSTGATGSLLKKLRPGGAFLFFSSGEVLQGLNKDLFSESDIGVTAPDHPRSCYIEGKRSGEAFCHAARSQGIRAMILRLGHIYGPGTRPQDHRVINMFIEKALTQGVIEMQDKGTAIRTWGYITDAVELCLAILFRGREAVYNVGGHSRCTIRELADEIAHLCGVEVKLPEKEQPVTGAPRVVELDVSRAEQEFGKRNYIALKEGLAQTIEYQRYLYRV